VAELTALAKVAVTCGGGKAGEACIKELFSYGYEVFNVDRVKPVEELCPWIIVDLADYGQTIDALITVERGPHGDGRDALAF
jgi:putative NADH-flavin reductase